MPLHEATKAGLFGLRFLLFASLLFLLPSEAPAGEQAVQEPLKLHSVRADFSQEKHLSILARPIYSTGTFVFQAPQSIRWEYHTPVRSLLLLHGGKTRRFVERNGRLQEEETMGFDSMQVVLADISSWLDGRFADNRMFRVSYPDKETVLLVPQEKGLAALISSIELKPGDQQGVLDEVTIFEGPESYTRLIFNNRYLNQEIPASLFIER